jgi:hypothetical protein
MKFALQAALFIAHFCYVYNRHEISPRDLVTVVTVPTPILTPAYKYQCVLSSLMHVARIYTDITVILSFIYIYYIVMGDSISDSMTVEGAIFPPRPLCGLLRALKPFNRPLY